MSEENLIPLEPINITAEERFYDTRGDRALVILDSNSSRFARGVELVLRSELAATETILGHVNRDFGETKEKMVDLKRQLDQIVRRGNEVAAERNAAVSEARSVQEHFQTLTRMATAVGQNNDLLKAQVAVLQERAGKAADRLLRDKIPDAAAVVEAINLLTFGTVEDPSKVITIEAQAMLEGREPDAAPEPVMRLLEELDPVKAAIVREQYAAKLSTCNMDERPALGLIKPSSRDPEDPFKLIDRD